MQENKTLYRSPFVYVPVVKFRGDDKVYHNPSQLDESMLEDLYGREVEYCRHDMVLLSELAEMEEIRQ